MSEKSLADMPLYTNLDRIARGLSARGIGAADQLGLGPTSRVLDIGSGVGGPARYLAHAIGCRVTALELQPELNAIAVDLTQRCGLTERVTHILGDALAYPFADGQFDAVVSWLAVLHIPDRLRLFKRLAGALCSGGGCYVEDLCMCAPFAPEDLRDLREVVFGVTVTSIEDYAKDVRAAGFVDVAATDLTSDWAPYAADRLLLWRQNHEPYARIHGEGAYAAQERFYSVIARLYESGSLGGVRVIGRAP